MDALSGDAPASLLQLLREKEKDLELAAKIGQSLLDQNRQLQNKNDFLEESLCASNEAIVQLRHEVQKRSQLLHFFSELEDEEPETPTRGGPSDTLKRRLRRLESENSTLKGETSLLRKKVEESGEDAERVACELGRQLEVANEKVHELQSQMAKKNEQCLVQAVEMERLLRELHERAHLSKAVGAENEELVARLEAANFRQERLEAEVSQLQENYAEVRAMFQEAESELRRLRERPLPRTSSADSLYDSLASELSDSGLCVSPRVQPPRPRVMAAVAPHEEVDVPSLVLLEATSKVLTAPAIRTPPQSPVTPLSPLTPVRLLPAHALVAVSLRRRVEEETALAVVSTAAVEAVSLRVEVASLSVEEVLVVETRRVEEEEEKEPDGESTDSFEEYPRRRLGEPGVPGTRDLYFSIRIRKARKELESDYAEFRRRQGLEPCPLFLDEAPPPPSPLAGPLGLALVASPEKKGVLHRTELPSPMRRHVHYSNGGLSSFFGRFSLSQGGVVSRRTS